MSAVSSHTEWQPLEEVVVGDPAGAMIPSWTTIERTTVPPGSESLDATIGQPGTPYRAELVEAAQRCVEEFIGILKDAGVAVRRPRPPDFAAGFSTPGWSAAHGWSCANPRDVFLVIGEEIIEAPMPDRARHYETWAYRALLKEYFNDGARWVAAPRPQLLDDLYRPGYEVPAEGEPHQWGLTDFEPVFDAADVVRCGRDIFIEASQVTNAPGIAWLRRHLGDAYRVHEVRPRYRRQMHIDTSLVPLAPGKVMVNPEFLDPDDLPEVFSTWDVLIAPEPVVTPKTAQGVMSRWSAINVLSLDERRVVVERNQIGLAKALEEWGFEPILCSFEDYTLFGGSFHCATLDVRRSGTCESYFDEPRRGSARAVSAPGSAHAERLIGLTEEHSAHNYHPLPVVIAEAEGAWVTDVDGNRYLDMLAGYSSLNFGHRNPVVLAAAREQLSRLTLTSRAFHHEVFGPFVQELSQLCGKDAALPMNSGTEAVETALKAARKWGYQVKGVPQDRAQIITCEGNFHGRTLSVVSFSTDPEAREEFGPFTPGFVSVPYGNASAIESAITDDTVAVLLEPIQGEAGVLVPPAGYLTAVRAICTRRGILFIADEIQSGLGRTGETFACDVESVVPDVYLLGKALGGGVLPVSAVVADRDVLGVFKPGEHGSTFGGNPLACAVGRAVIGLVRTGEYQERSRTLGIRMHSLLNELPSSAIREVRGRGLWAGVEIDPSCGTGRQVSERLMARGVLAKDTQGVAIRMSPPLVVTSEEIEWAVTQLREALRI
jgi:ornithine--oxo-acid transaminase